MGAPMFARIPRLVVIAAPVFFALAIASSAAADEKSPNPKAACNQKLISACQKRCYNTYEREILATGPPGEALKLRKQYFQCRKGCRAKECGTAVAR
jgi:hypothetical protein